MVAPVVASLIVTDVGPVMTPAAGLITGVEAAGLPGFTVYVPVVVALVVKPVATAIALIVVVELTVIAPVYGVEAVVGVEPFVV